MPIETGGIITLVAGSSVLASLVTQGVAAFLEGRKTDKDASFSALYLAIALESYASECSAALGDSENYMASGGHAGAQRGLPDIPDYPESIEWKPLGIEHTNEAMSFRVEVETARTMIADYWDVVGDEDDLVPMIREETARLGKKALELAIRFRKSWKIKAVDYSGEWNVQTYLSEKVEKYAQDRKIREERDRKMNQEMFESLEAANVKVEGT